MKMWKRWKDSLPDKIDGLIFTPVCFWEDGDHPPPVVTWRPFVNVAVGGPLEKTETHTRFRAYVYDQGPFALPQTEADAIPADHFPFRIDQDRCSTIMRDIPIHNEKRADGSEEERPKWDSISLKCTVSKCPCQKVQQVAGRAIRHCKKCGALVAARLDTDFSCAGKCHYNQAVVWVPNEMADEAKHGIIEASIGDNAGSLLLFNRCQKHKDVADSALDISRQFAECRLLSRFCNPLSKDIPENELISFYCTAAFESEKRNITGEASSTKHLISPRLDPLAENEIIQFLTIPDIVRCRGVSKLWRRTVGGFKVPETTRNSYFGSKELPKRAVYYRADWESYLTPRMGWRINARTLAQYIHFGGRPVQYKLR